MKPQSTVGRGFISYRRQDSDALATLLKERLKRALPDWEFFLDFGAIAAGTDFKAVIADGLAKSDLLIVLMEENWIGARASGSSRISDDSDFVRFEVASALQSGMRILPVLINDAKMPSAAVLPPDVAGLRAINALELRVSVFDDDFPRLVEAISGEPMRPETESLLSRASWWAAGAFGGAIIGILALYLLVSLTGRPLGASIGNDGAALVSGLWVLAGAWLGDIVRRRWR